MSTGILRHDGIYFRRWMWWAPWGITDPWRPRLLRGGDEWCNDSVAAGLPFTGLLAISWRRRLRALPCRDCWRLTPDWQQADYAPCGWLHDGRLRDDAHHHVDGICDDARGWLAGERDGQ
jgi:hypothetical protein